MTARVRPITDFVYEMGRQPVDVSAGTGTIASGSSGLELTMTGDTSGTHAIEITQTNTSASGDSNAILINTDADFADAAAGIAIINTGYADGMYVGLRGRTSGAAAPVGIGIDINRIEGGSAENNATSAGHGLVIFNWSSSASIGSCVDLANESPANLSPLINTTSDGTAIVMRPIDAAGHSSGAMSVLNASGTTMFYVRYDGNIKVTLPTSNPGAGLLWCDVGAGNIVKVGT
jgi:hypothetical protein